MKKINIKIKAILILFLVFQSSYAEIFHCKDKSGNTIFKDSSCSNDENQIDKILYKNTHYPSNKELKLDDTLKVIYQGKTHGTETRFVRVAIFEETSKYLTLEVTGYFSGNPKGTLQFRVVPNTRWAYSGDVQATKRGLVTAYTRITLNQEAKENEKSDILSLQLWHYYTEHKKNKSNRLGMLTVPFKKDWEK